MAPVITPMDDTGGSSYRPFIDKLYHYNLSIRGLCTFSEGYKPYNMYIMYVSVPQIGYWGGKRHRQRARLPASFYYIYTYYV